MSANDVTVSRHLQRSRLAGFPGLARYIDRPQTVELETVNICNAKCRFCPYPQQVPKKSLMSDRMFEDVARQITACGMGELCLTPMLGDPLLDPQIAARAARLRELGNLEKLRLITNGLALDRHSDDELVLLFDALDVLEISLGPNRHVHHAMFGVDQFEHLIEQLERVCDLVGGMANPPRRILLCGRACGDEFATDPRIDGIARRLCGTHEVVWSREYFDWGGRIGGLPLNTPVVAAHRAKGPDVPCAHALYAHIYQDGKVGLCSRAGADESFLIGDLKTTSWIDILNNPKRLDVILSFLTGDAPAYCQRCSFYQASGHLRWERYLGEQPADL